MHFKLFMLIGVISAGFIAPPQAAAACGDSIYVRLTSPDPQGNGTSQHPFANLSSALSLFNTCKVDGRIIFTGNPYTMPDSAPGFSIDPPGSAAGLPHLTVTQDSGFSLSQNIDATTEQPKTRKPLFTISRPNTELDALVISKTAWAGIYIYGASNVTVSGNTISNGGGPAISAEWVTGTMTNLKFNNNTISGAAALSLNAGTYPITPHWWVGCSGPLVKGGWAPSISVLSKNSQSFTITGVAIINNTIKSSYGESIALKNVAQSEIYGNRIADTFSVGIYFDHSYGRVSGNVVEATATALYRLYPDHSCTPAVGIATGIEDVTTPDIATPAPAMSLDVSGNLLSKLRFGFEAYQYVDSQSGRSAPYGLVNLSMVNNTIITRSSNDSGTSLSFPGSIHVQSMSNRGTNTIEKNIVFAPGSTAYVDIAPENITVTGNRWINVQGVPNGW